MVVFPVCKINLGLQILRKRADGFHDIASVFCPVKWCDVLEIVATSGKGKVHFQSSGIPIPPGNGGNLCEQAYHLLLADFPALPSVNIHLHKNIPIGAGLGGGSSDGAQTLVVLNQLFDLGLSVTDLRSYAAVLGSDCAFFVEAKPMLVEGRGEVLKPLSLVFPKMYIRVVHPGIHISTAEAYSGVVPKDSSLELDVLLAQPVSAWRELVHNQFEDSLFPKYQLLADLKQQFYDSGAAYASMTGSGSAVYGLYLDEPAAMDRFSEFTQWEGPVTWEP